MVRLVCVSAGGWATAVLMSYRIWPAVYLINFAFVPEELRVVFVATVNLFWVAFPSVVGNKATAREATGAIEEGAGQKAKLAA